MTVSRIQKVTEFVEEVDRLLSHSPRGAESLAAAPDNRLSVILRESGWQRRTPVALHAIARALGEQGISTWPDLATGDLGTDERVYFFRGKPGDLMNSRWHFAREQGLEEFVFENWNDLPLPIRGIELIRTQYTLAGRRFDVIGWRRRKNELVVIEFKNVSPDHRTVGQLAEYLRILEDHSEAGVVIPPAITALDQSERAFQGYSVRGILITAHGDEQVRQSLRQLSTSERPIDWWRYQLSVDLTPIALED